MSDISNHLGISLRRGFLPDEDPLESLPGELRFLDEFGRNLPALIRENRVNQEVRNLPIPDPSVIYGLNRRELQLAWLRYSFIQSACVHTQEGDSRVICKNIALGADFIAQILSKPPILSYDSYTLNNWRRKDKNGPIKVDNLELIQTFIDDFDQAWFILIHVDIEAEAAMAIRSLREAILAVERKDAVSMESTLLNIDKSLEGIIATMKRMPEGTSPDTYYKIRPWIMSFENVVYEGVLRFNGQPQSFRGQTGAQSAIFQAIEAGLQMPRLEDNQLSRHLYDMRNYMPLPHREFIVSLEKISKVRYYISDYEPSLAGIYNSCVDRICDFLDIHFGYAFTYIHKQTSNPKGTGGTDFMKYLKGRVEERRNNAYIKN